MERGKKYYDWNCWKCKKRNFQNRASCIECGAPDKRPADWNCPNCQSVVFGSKDHCFKCGTKSPNGKPVPEKRPNDWNCPNCQFLVWGSKNQCSKCGAASPNGSQTRPGDWTCGCSASNFAKRSHCYVFGK